MVSHVVIEETYDEVVPNVSLEGDCSLVWGTEAGYTPLPGMKHLELTKVMA